MANHLTITAAAGGATDLLNYYETPFTAMMTGLALGSFLAGLATLQTLGYFWVNKRDPVGHKFFVFLTWVLAIVQISFHAQATWFCVVHQPARAVVFLSWPFRVQIWMVILIAVLTKLLYIGRIWRLAKIRRKPPIIAIIIFLFVLSELGFGILSGYDMYIVEEITGLAVIERKWAAFVAVSLVTLDDVLVVLGLVYSLVMTTTNLSWTDSSMVMFCAYVLNTGLIAAISSIISLISFAVNSVSPVFFVVIVVLPQIYTNCFLAMMNARFYFQAYANSNLPTIFIPTDREFTVMTSGPSRNSATAQPLTRSLTINEAGFPSCDCTTQGGGQCERCLQGSQVPLEVLVERKHESTSMRRGFWAV